MKVANLVGVGSKGGLRSANESRVFRLAKLLNRHAPRGRGALPRKLGRWFPSEQFYLEVEKGVRLVMSPGSIDVYCHLANRGQWEPHVLQACEAVLRDGDVFYDIGANVGYMCMCVAAHFKDAVEVIAFEPQPDLVTALHGSMVLNGFQNVRVVDHMLGSESGEAELYMSSHSTHASALPREASAHTIACRKSALDDLVSSGELPPPNVIKIDIEGGELDCFRGAQRTLEKYRPHVVLEADSNMERFGYSEDGLLHFLEEIGGYEFFRIEREEGRLTPLASCSQGDILGNVLARRMA